MEIYLAHTQGFCAGVARAINVLEKALKKYGAPLYAYHEIVHNTAVVEDFKKRGVLFVENINGIPDGSHVVFSAHGVSPEIIAKAKEKKLHVIDATCLLVEKVHREAKKFSERNVPTILIGHRYHQEIVGTSGYVKPELLHIIISAQDIDKLDIDPSREVGYLTQTTLSLDDTENLIHELKSKFPKLIGSTKKDICYATQNRQDAIKEMAKICDLIIICGSPNSSNSNRLREIGEKRNIPSTLVDRAKDFDLKLLEGKNKIGISSGASVPKFIVDELIEKIKSQYPDVVIHVKESPEKKIVFPLPSI
ncbi:MAG: 4-hydroxy-3-methylbut-2-enyl diphosphate reductase [Candidatus Omnitrophota bacterium]